MKVKNCLLSLGLLLPLATACRAQALPTLYPTQFNRELHNSTNSNVVADSQDSTRFYVLPPNRSSARIQNLNTVTANVGFCEEIANLQRYNADTLDLLNKMKTKNSEAQQRVEEQGRALRTANAELAQFVSDNHLSESAELDAKILHEEKRLDALYDQMKNCAAACGQIGKEIADVQKLRQDLEETRWRVGWTNLDADLEYKRRQSRVNILSSNFESATENLRTIQSDLKELYVDFNQMFDAHAKREGGRVTINYESDWFHNVEKLSHDNPGLQFEKMQTKNAAIKAGAYDKNNLLPGGAVLSFDVGGQNASGILVMSSFPESFSGNAVLNLLAVCPLLHPEWFDIKVPVAAAQMSYPLTVSYEYPVTMNYEVTASYNMYRMYELIKTQGKSGGFFNSKSWSNADEQEYFKDAFRVDWKVQDDRQLFTEEQKLAVNSDLRRQIMSRLANFLIMNDNSTKVAAPEDAPTNGAMVLSNSLNKYCPVNLTCQGASIVFNVLQAIFGSSSTMQNLKRITNVTMSDTYRSEQVVLQPMLSSFQ